jgi:hypothetical protein
MYVPNVRFKSPLIPLFTKGEFSPRGFRPLFGKEGKGRFLAENVAAIIQRISDTPH